MILFAKRILPGVGAVDYRSHCVLISAETLMCPALLQTKAYIFMFAQIRDPHVFCFHTINEGLFSSIGGVVFANINC